MRRKHLVFFAAVIVIAGFSCSEEPSSPQDHIKPTISFLSPANDSEFSEGTAIAISLTATDNKQLSSVSVDVDGSQAVIFLKEPFIYHWDTYRQEGTHIISARAIDMSNNVGETEILTVRVKSSTSSTVKDIDGTVYRTVKIGSQWWMAENLRVTHYNDGSPITLVTDMMGVWPHLTSGACTYPGENVLLVPDYGLLYNWLAAADNRGIAPSGWHLPRNEEYQILIDFLGGSDVAGGKLKESGTMHWASPNTGGTNESGFCALPAGEHNYDGTSYGCGTMAYLWSSTPSPGIGAYYYYLSCKESQINYKRMDENCSASIRCVR